MGRKLSKEEFVLRSIAKHGNKYDYTLVEYKKNSIKVRIICPEHGEFKQTPADHMKGKGCKKCGIIKNSKKRALSQEEFIKIANEVHKGKYDYSKVKYVNIDTKVIIGCPIHGDYEQVPYSHIRMKCGCEKCGYVQTGLKLRKPLEKFLVEAKEVHGSKYDYSQVKYESADKKVTIVCPEHGPYRQAPYVHVNQKCGCYECGRLKSSYSRRIGLKRFIEDSVKSHTEIYDYSNSIYTNSNTEIEIICTEHGSFFQLPILHRYGARCPKCCGRNRSTEDYVRQASIVHNGKYNYSKTIYSYAKDKVIIICPEHGEFSQTAVEHLTGKGCPYCAGNVPVSKDEFLRRARDKYGDKFDYSHMDYTDYTTPVNIICPTHGDFMMQPMYHLNYAMGCVACSRDRMSENMSMSNEEYIEKAQNIHGDRYDYNLVDYSNSKTKIKIICKKHHYVFEQDPSSHLSGCGCPKCNASRMELRIWRMLELHKIPFIPQARFEWLKFIKPLSLDFYLPEHNVGIECQGLQHFGIAKKGKRIFTDIEDIKQRDKIKYALCKEHGVKVLYFCNEKKEYLSDTYIDTIYRTQNELLKVILSQKK